jgi:hypothetical protein
MLLACSSNGAEAMRCTAKSTKLRGGAKDANTRQGLPWKLLQQAIAAYDSNNQHQCKPWKQQYCDMLY